ncbi:dTDP-4-dehydrorhamnose reductase [Candidatus Kuenenbacteria bacterium]|nr:dTDP-4-dehydrorhamnose reductase [Candidatus Kuenenbacteria bacterium]
MKIALIGSTGQLGTDFKKVIPAQFLVNLDYPNFDLTKKDLVREQLLAIRPDIVINTAAYNLVDRAEDFPEEALAVNYYGVKNLVDVCLELDCILVHYSSDYIFGGEDDRRTPYTEEDHPAPINQYGQSKLLGEQEIIKRCQKYFIIRTSGLFGTAGSEGKGGNFIESIIKKGKETGELKIVDDQFLTPTYTLDLARQSWQLMQTEHFGLYHATSEWECSWYEFGREVMKYIDPNIKIIPVKTSEYQLPAQRPKYCVLENKKLKELGLNIMRPWAATIPDYLQEKGYLQ